MFTTDEMFATVDQWGGFHDALFEIDEKERTAGELRVLFETLPEEIRNIAHCWGMSDTVFRDDAYVYFRDNGIPE